VNLRRAEDLGSIFSAFSTISRSLIAQGVATWAQRKKEKERAGSSESCVTSLGAERVFRVTFVRLRNAESRVSR